VKVPHSTNLQSISIYTWLTKVQEDCEPTRRFSRQLACSALRFINLSLNNDQVSLFTVSSRASLISFRFARFARFGGFLLIVLVVISRFGRFVWLFRNLEHAAESNNILNE